MDQFQGLAQNEVTTCSTFGLAKKCCRCRSGRQMLKNASKFGDLIKIGYLFDKYYNDRYEQTPNGNQEVLGTTFSRCQNRVDPTTHADSDLHVREYV